MPNTSQAACRSQPGKGLPGKGIVHCVSAASTVGQRAKVSAILPRFWRVDYIKELSRVCCASSSMAFKLSFGLKAKQKAKPALFQASDDEGELTAPAAKRQRTVSSPGPRQYELLFLLRLLAALGLTSSMRLGVQSSVWSRRRQATQRCKR